MTLKQTNNKKSLSIQEINQLEWYHTIDLGVCVTKGRYDWRPYVAKLGLKNLKGKTVLDVGAGNGFFSFMLEKEGAKVTATDIPSQNDRDNHKFSVKKKVNSKKVNFSDPFNVAKRILGSKVKRKIINIYSMKPSNTGTYEVVFCNDVLLHLTDPVRALRIFSSIATEQVIVGTPIAEPDKSIVDRFFKKRNYTSEPSIALFTGATGNGAFWLPTIQCLRDMCVTAGLFVTDTKKITPKPKHAECSLPRGIIYCKKKGQV